MGQLKAMEGQAGDATSTRALARSRSLRALLVTAVGLLCALAWTGSASASIHRGHVFGSTFEGSGEQAFSNASGVAVNESSGEVYVVDAGHERVERFAPDGSGGFQFVSEWSVPNPEGIAIDNDLSSPSHGDVYVPGVEKAPKKGEEAETERNWLYKYTATGEKIYKRHVSKAKEKVTNELGESELEEFETEFENIHGVAVDATGQLWVTWETEGYIAGFNNEERNKLIGSTYKEGALFEQPESSEETLYECTARAGFAVAPNDEFFYVAHEKNTGLEACPEEASTPTVVAKLKTSGAGVTPELTSQDSRGVGVDLENGDVYVDNVASVLALTSSGQTIQRFGESHLTAGNAIAVSSESGGAAATRGDVFVAEGSKVVVFVPESESGSPSIDSASAQALSSSSARLSASINPHGSDTHYYFQYGTVNCAQAPTSCTDVPAAPGADIGAGFDDVAVEQVIEGLQPNTAYFYRVIAQNGHGSAESAQSASTFFVTLPSAQGLLADNREWEMVSPPTKGGPLEAPTKEGPAAVQASESGDTLAYGTPNSGPSGEAQGNRSITITPFLFSREEAGWSTQDLATPHNQAEGFESGGQPPEYRLFSPDLALAIVEPEEGAKFPIEEPPLSPALRTGETQEKTIYLRDNPPLKPSASEQKSYEEAAANNAYLNPGYLALVTQVNDTAGNPFGAALSEQSDGFLDATPDLSHVVFKSGVPLLPSMTGEGLYEWNADDPAHSLVPISVLPNGQSAPGARLGGHAIFRNAISSDGTHVVFTSGDEETNEQAHLFLRDTQTGVTVQINAVQGQHVREPTPEEEAEETLTETHYQGASADGTRIFFTDTWPLTDSSTLHPVSGVTGGVNPSDLYEYNTVTGSLRDITPAAQVGEPADVLGTIPGVSEDGSDVYFVANGALTPNAAPGTCPRSVEGVPPAGPSCNLYLSEVGSGSVKTRLIARLSDEDSPDWGQGVNASAPAAPEAGNLIYETARVSPNGRYLAFMSNRSLTGYDNEDTTSAAPGERLDEEAYLFDAAEGSLRCASCNPSGQRPRGVLDTSKGSEPSLLVDRSLVWEGKWLAGSIPGWNAMTLLSAIYQPRYLSDTGRLFFNSPDKLVSQDENQKEDVYEYESSGNGTCTLGSGCVTLISSGSKFDERESTFIDASVSGDDAFFLTSERLLAQDYDTNYDLYDARVCGTSESSACLPAEIPPPLPCKEEECKPASSPPPNFSASGTASHSGPGNEGGVLGEQKKVVPPTKKPLTRAQKLSKALKTCKTKFKHKKKKRQACEKQARKQYGAKKAKKSKAKKSSATAARRHA
jgi:hypothetical protein